MLTSRRAVLGGMTAAAVAGSALAVPGALPSEPWLTAPGEFEPQDFIWLPWVKRGFFGAPPLSSVMLELMKILTPFVRVRLLHSGQLPIERGDSEPPQLAKAESEARVFSLLAAGGIDLGRVELIYNELPYGAIQDPGPFFLRFARGGLAIADFRLNHADPRAEGLDRAIAAGLGLPTVRSPLVSEGGGRQSNGRGTLLLARSVEQARNPGWSQASVRAAALEGPPIAWRLRPLSTQSGRLAKAYLSSLRDSRVLVSWWRSRHLGSSILVCLSTRALPD